MVFTALALAPGPSEAEPEPEVPLEIVITPRPPEPEEEAAATAQRVPEPNDPALALPSLGANAERTELDSLNLRRSETAPQNTTRLAAHHALAGRMRGSAPALPAPTPLPRADAAGAPRPTPAPRAPQAAGGVSLAAVAGEAEAADGEGEGGGEAAIGAFRKAVSNAIGVRWDHYRRTKMALLGVGSVRIKFAIDARGKVSNLRVTTNTAGPEAALSAVRAITEAEIPPIPAERLARLPNGRLEVEYSFTLFPTQ